MAKYAFFLGCIAPLRYPGIEKSTREVFKALDVELVDVVRHPIIRPFESVDKHRVSVRGMQPV